MSPAAELEKLRAALVLLKNADNWATYAHITVVVNGQPVTTVGNILAEAVGGLPQDDQQNLLRRLERERDRAVARAERLAELNPDRDRADADMQEALREIESLAVANVAYENGLANCGMMMRRLIVKLRRYDEHSSLAKDATDLLERLGLQGSVLREESPAC